MRKVGIAVLIIVVVLIAAALIIPHFVNVNKYHEQIQAQLQKRLGRQVTLGDMRLSLIPLSFQVQNAVIGEDKSFNTQRPFAEAEKLAVSVKLLPLLHKDVEVKSIELVRPHVELIRNAQGTWNFASLGHASETAQQPVAPPAESKAKAPAGKPAAASPAPAQPSSQEKQQKQASSEISLANLVITDGQVAITDQQKHQSRAVYDHIDLDVSDFAPGQQFSIKVAAHLPGSGKQTVYIQGKGGPIQQADMLNTPFDGTLKLDQVSLSAAQKFLNSQALNGIDASISGNANIKNSQGKMASSGSIKLDRPVIHKVDVGYPITLDYDVTDDLTSDVIQIGKANLKLGSTPITVSGMLNTRPTPSQMDLKVTASNASISEAARLASAFGVAFGQGMTVNGLVNADIQAKGATDKPQMNGKLSASNLEISGKELPQPVKINAIELALTPTDIHSNDFTASTGSTNVTVNFALANYAAQNSTINASLKAPNARIAELLSMAKAAGVSAVDGMTGDGTLTLDAHAQGPTKNMSALIFSGTGKIQNASLKPPSLTKPLQIHNTDIGFSQNSAILNNIAISLGSTNANGNLTLKNFAAPQVQFTLNADKVDVAELQQITESSPAPQKRAAADFWRLIPEAQAQATPAQNQPSIITKMTGGGNISVGTVQYNDLVLNNLRSTVTLDHGLIKMNPVTAALYNGQENGSITVDMRPAQPVYAVNLKTSNVDANKLVSSVSDLKQTLYGLLASNVNASFSSSSANNIARSLNGTLGINLTNGRLMNIDMLHELATVGKFLGSAIPNAPKGFTDLMQLSGNFDVKNGVAQTNDLKAVISGGTMAAAGLVNLADQTMNLHVTAVLDKALSQQVGGTNIGGFMNTALANNQGELVIPVIVTGSFKSPRVEPDLQQLAQMKLKNLLPTSKNPGQLTNGILGQVLGHGQNNGTGQQQGGLGGILGAISGQNQQQQKQQQQQQPGVGQNPGQQPQPQQQQQNQNPLGGILGQVLNRNKPTPTPTPQK